jgi:anti-anti-sigma factor
MSPSVLEITRPLGSRYQATRTGSATAPNQNLLSITAEWHGPIGVVTASGALDANFAAVFARRVTERMILSRKLIVDLSGLSFCAVAGYHAMCDVDLQSEELGTSWVVVPSLPVERILRLCDPHHHLPLVPSLEKAWEVSDRDKWPA